MRNTSRKRHKIATYESHFYLHDKSWLWALILTRFVYSRRIERLLKKQCRDSAAEFKIFHDFRDKYVSKYEKETET